MTLALLAALLLQDDLKIARVSLVDSKGGPARAKMAVQPFEWATLRFELLGMKENADGERKIAFEFSVADAEGKAVLKDQKGTAGGIDTFPPSTGCVICQFRVGEDVKGPVTLTLNVTDEVGGKKALHAVKVEILPVSLAVVTPHFAVDRAGDVHRAPVFGLLEQTMLFYDVVGLKNTDKGVWFQQDVEIVDAGTGKRVYFKEKLFDYKSGKALGVVNANYPVFCSRAGKYVLRILGRDMNDGGKAFTREVPFEVVGY